MRLRNRLLTVECGAVVKANAYGLGLEPVTAKLAKAGCKTFFVADVAEARRVRARAREAAIYVLNGFAPEAAERVRRTERATGYQQHDRTRGVGCLRRRSELARRRGAPCRYRHEPARHHRGRSRRLGAARADRKPRHHAVDEPPRLRRDRRPPAHRQPNPAVSRTAHALSRHPRFAGQLVRYLPRRFGAFRYRTGPAPRSMASTRRRTAPIPCKAWSN